MKQRTAFSNGMLLTALAFGLMTAGVSAQDWPRYRRDAARSGVVAESLDFPLQLHWVYEPDRSPRPAWPDPVREPHRIPIDWAPVPVIADGLLYFGSTTDDSIRALDAESGELRWRFTTGAPVRLAPDIADGRAYAASDDGYLYCLDARTGELVWRFHASRTDRMVLGNERMISRRPLRSGALVDDGVVYTTAGMWPAEGVIIYALDADTGDVLWQNDTTLDYILQPHAGPALAGPTPQGYLALGGDVLLVASGRTVPAGFDRNDGSLLYFDQHTHADRAHDRGGSWLTVDPEANLYFNMVDWASCLSTGERADGGGVRYVPEDAVRAGEVLIEGDDGRVAAYDADWSADVDGYARRMAVADGRLYVSTDAGRIYCFAPGEPADEAPKTVRPDAPAAPPEPGPIARGALDLLQERRLNRGYALVLGEPEPGLAQSLAAATELHVLQVLDTEDAARAARGRLLDSTDLYGSRIAVTHKHEEGGLKFPPYFANIIIGSRDTLEVGVDDIHHALRPTGGLWLPGPGQAAPDELELRSVARDDSELGVVLGRGRLPGAFDWDSESPADERVRWPLELSWFGGPGPARAMNRHQRAPMPVAADGRYFQIGHHYLTAVDAYNGTELWSRHIPFAALGRRGGPGATIQSLSADDENLYLNVGTVVYRLDPQTGRQRGVYGTFDEPERHALDDPKRFDFDVQRSQTQAGALTLTPGEDGLRLELETQQASDADMWELFFDFRPPERRADIYEPGDLDVFRVVVWAPTGRPFPWFAPRTPEALYSRAIMPFTRSGTGEFFSVPAPGPWEIPDDVDVDPDNPAVRLGMEFEGGAVADGTKVNVLLPWEDLPAAADGAPAEFAFTATLVSYEQRRGVVRTHPFGTDDTAGTFNNGWPVFELDAGAAGEPSAPEAGSLADLPERALDWGPSPPRHQQQEVHAPAAFTGDERTARGPLDREFYYGTYGCGITATTAHMDILRSATLAYYDIDDASGLRNFAGVRPGCGDAALPVLGLLISPEASSGCTCSYSFQTSLALAPTDRRRNEDWAIYFERVEPGTRLDRTGVNLGAPGDRRDEDGRLWVGFPRTLAVQRESALPLPLVVEHDERFDPLRINTDFTPVAGTVKPWVYGSCIRGARRIDVDLRFRDPQWSVLSLSEARPPAVDGVLDDPIWDGAQRVQLPERAFVQFRHDDEHLYIGYERDAFVDRRGRRTPWRLRTEEGEEPVWKEDHFGLRLASGRGDEWGDIVRFAVSASGERYSSFRPTTVDVPRLEDLTLDGQPGDWDEEGFHAKVAPGVESRFAWDDRGLWILTTLREDAMTEEEMPNHFTLVAASLDDLRRHMRLKIDLDERAWEVIGEDAKKAVQVEESREEGLHVIEALLPLEDLNLEPGAGVEIALPIFYAWPARLHRPREGGFFRNPRLNRSSARLRLAEQASEPRRVVFSTPGRNCPLAYFAVEEEPITGEWSSAVHLTDERFTAELTIPWSDIECFGLDRNELLVNFAPSPPTDDNIEDLQRFDEQSRTFHLDDAPVEARRYTVRLHFAELDERVGPGERVFDVALQGETVLEALDVVAEAGGHRRALVREFRGVEATRLLELTFNPQGDEVTQTSAPILAGFEIEEERND